MHRLISTLTLFAWFTVTGQAAIIQFSTNLLGANENPAVPSPGSGTAFVTYDDLAHTLVVHASFFDLLGLTTASHIHCCADVPTNVGVATYPGTFPGFIVGVTSGTYDSPAPIDLTQTSSYTATFLNNFGGGTAAGAEAALIQGMFDGRAYFNIHTSLYPGGEIRGHLSEVPEPGTFALGGLALAAVAAGHRRRRRAA